MLGFQNSTKHYEIFFTLNILHIQGEKNHSYLKKHAKYFSQPHILSSHSALHFSSELFLVSILHPHNP